MVRATRAVVCRRDFRIIHVSLQTDHVHLIVEADSNEALARGVQAFEVSAVCHVNRAFGRSGQLFDDRYHAELIASPTQARHAIAYVLGNWRHHGHDAVWGDESIWDVDYYSSAVSFDGWLELCERSFKYEIQIANRLCVSAPQTWLLRTGWRRAGTISMAHVPGSQQ